MASAGIAPKNGWIADYPMTPDIIGELEKAIIEAADARKLPMGKDEALRVFRTTALELELPIIAEIPTEIPRIGMLKVHIRSLLSTLNHTLNQR